MTTTQIAILAMVLFAAFIFWRAFKADAAEISNEPAPRDPTPEELAAEYERLRAQREAASVPVIKPKRPG